ncbi:DUF3656 domain-containing U32 family peptidase [Natronincola ferrireducens]|uniref:Putative protease n=1 Tax=Natronincola ferrireducens TaxID=393762 RepID=A0A1G9EGF1_9FIRM|nr:U32 family peptidase [Natronincola ferrireducens]SDK75229.1 putative protease [Natronincola ferrireducens]
MKKVELLAPAGSYEAFVAAVQNGADAVYLGGRVFSARAYASNFDIPALEEAIEYAHIRGVKVYVTINTLIKDTEMKELLQYVSSLYQIGVDAVIVQDLGVVKILRDYFPHLEIHCSTQMTLHNSLGIQLLYEMGVKRVVLARELSLGDIQRIHRNSPVELEVFIHGALCYSYSGQCLMSSFIGGRSGNRGRCAQPCRKPYEILSLDKNNSRGSALYYLSMRDLNTLGKVGEIIESGVTSFKIEGRMKKPQYVVSIVNAYRRAIDAYLLYKEKLKDKEIEKQITQVFNRKFTEGYILNPFKKEKLNIDKPNNRGLFLGKVEEYDSRKMRMRLKLAEDIRQGDGIEIWGDIRDRTGGIINKLFLYNKLTHEAKAGEVVEIQLEGNIKKGDEVYKTLDLQLMKTLEKSYNKNVENRKVKLYGQVKLYYGMPLKLYIWDEEGNNIYKESLEPVEKAQKVALTKEKIRESLGKLGNTPFELMDMKVDLEDNTALSLSIINKVRRDAIEELINLRKNKGKRKYISNKKEIFCPTFLKLKREKNDQVTIPKLSIKVDTLEQLKAALEEKIDRVYYGNIEALQEAIELCRAKEVEIFFRSPSIIKDEENEGIQEVLQNHRIDGILAGELGMIDFTKNTLGKTVIADTSLNTLNSNTIGFLQELGANGVTLSTELDLKNIKELKVHRSLEVEIVVYGKLLVMITETCPLVSVNQCHHHCEKCKEEVYHYKWGLKDEKGIIFPFTKDYLGKTIIVNAKPLYMMDKINDLMDIRLTSYRLEFTDEKPKDVIRIIKEYRKSIEVLLQGGDLVKPPSKSEGFTRGHYYRGVE